MIGEPGVDAAGYPRETVDAVGLRSLLMARRYAELTRYLEQTQDDFEADPRRELWMPDAMRAFSTTDPSVGRRIDEWRMVSRASFAPHLARAAFHLAVATVSPPAERCAAPATEGKTREEEPTRGPNDLAVAHLSYESARELRDGLVVADLGLMQVAALTGDVELERTAFARAVQRCPACTIVWRAAVVYGSPGWGGTPDLLASRAALAVSHTGENPRLASFAGYVAWGECDERYRGSRWRDAIDACTRALAYGENEDFLVYRAGAYEMKGRFADALADLERAWRLRHRDLDRVGIVVRAYAGLRRWEEAGLRLVRGLQLDPFDESARRLVPLVRHGLVRLALQDERARRYRAMFEALDRARVLDPYAAEVTVASLQISDRFEASHAAELPALRARARSHPTDYWACHDLDYAADGGELHVWDRYLAAHPFDAQAYVERSGTRSHHADRAGAGADARRACELGHRAGCLTLELGP